MMDPAFVLHVKQGYEDRAKSITAQFAALGLPFAWLLDFDIPEISPEMLKQYGYRGNLRPSEVSCCLKHIRAWELISTGSEAGGFVFEDDVLLDIKRFKSVVAAALAEFAANFPEKLACLCFGNGCALHVPWTKREKGRHLYPAGYVRTADSYWLSKETAAALLAGLVQKGFVRPADHMIDELCRALAIPILWEEPTVASQGSHTGRFFSSIQTQERRPRLWKAIEWRIKIIRRKYLFPLLGIDQRWMD